MANKRNSFDLSSLMSGTGSRQSSGRGAVTNLISRLTSTENSRSASLLGRASGISRSNLQSKLPTPIHFGSPSSSKTTAASGTGTDWGKVLTSTTSGGFGSLLGGGLAGFTGIGSLISGIVSLFGGGSKKPALAPLVRFQLPGSQTQTAYFGSKGTSVMQGIAEQQVASGARTAIYKSSAGVPLNANSGAIYDSAKIAQAVKQALLNSSSLNDVIAEI